MAMIADMAGWEILDSRGRPTVAARCILDSGAAGSASVPSGASTGGAEALELRDGDSQRYRGFGCRKAANHVSGEIREAILHCTFNSQSTFDHALIALDGTPSKSRLGANALLAASIAFARAVASQRRVPLYQHFAEMLGRSSCSLPRLTINLFSGGKHAGGQVPIQDVLIVPVAAATIDEALATAFEVYQSAAELTGRKYGTRMLTADEGGLAPPFPNVETMLSDAVESIHAAGLTPGREVSLAVDVAASHFLIDGRYQMGDKWLSSLQMIDLLDDWLNRFPIISVEDGLAENDWEFWPQLCERVSDRAIVLGDDLLCTNPARITRAIEAQATNALLLKVNQIGTLTEAAEALRLARSAGWKVTISARSGETEDNWLADLAVGWNAHYIKVGSITQSERLSKYNRLLAIERDLRLPVAT